MTASPSEAHPALEPTPNALTPQLRWHRVGAVLLLVLGGLLLAANLNLLPPAAQRLVGWGWPVLVILAGGWLLVAGWPRPAAGPTFALPRGEYAAGEVIIQTGTADLKLGALTTNVHLAEGQLPTPRGPAVTTIENVARLRMTPRLAVPWLPGREWALALAPDLPWSVQAQSSLGDLNLDLREVQLTTLRLRSAMGHVEVTLPARGQADLSLSLGLGNLTLRVPEGMAVKVKVRRGRLVTLKPDARRFVELTPGEWTTPLYAVSPARCTLTVNLWAGDLTLT